MDQIEMINAGTVFYSGPVVDSIVDNMRLAEKFFVLQKILEEDEMRPPGATRTMSGWKEAIERALNNQRVVRNYSTTFLGDLSCILMQTFPGDKDVIPNRWLNNGQIFERLLQLCPNLTGIHFIEHGFEYSLQSACLNENTLNAILRLVPNLTTLTWRKSPKESMWPILVKILRNRKGHMEFIDISDVGFDRQQFVKELIIRNPNLTGIATKDVTMDFVRKYLQVRTNVLRSWTPNGTVSELCRHFHRCNSHYRKSSANGVKLIGINYLSFEIQIYQDLLDSFVELEKLTLRYPDQVDIRQLKVMKKMKSLDLTAVNSQVKTQVVAELLPHLSELTYLRVSSIHSPCPVVSVETLRGICQLAKLEKVVWTSFRQTYMWSNGGIDEMNVIN